MAKAKIDLETARTYAETVVKALAPHCERIEIAGSIRRRKPEVREGNIIVPTPEEQDFFDLCDMDFVPPEKRGL